MKVTALRWRRKRDRQTLAFQQTVMLICKECGATFLTTDYTRWCRRCEQRAPGCNL